jgi:hypothetical protein
MIEDCPHDGEGEGDWCYQCWSNVKTGQRLEEKAVLYRVVTPFATALITVEDGIITRSAPIFRRFVGQPVENMANWSQVKAMDVLNVPDEP